MEIIWHGDTCFTIHGKHRSLIINPTGALTELKADVILYGKEGGITDVKGEKKIFEWPGEYEVYDIPIIAFKAWTKSRTSEKETGKSESTLIFCFEIDGIKICHLGELGHALTSDMIKEIGDVDILMIKTGENSNLDSSKAMEIIEAIEPRAIIPMGENDPAVSLKNMGTDKVEAIDSFEIKSIAELPEDKMQYIVLKRT